MNEFGIPTSQGNIKYTVVEIDNVKNNAIYNKFDKIRSSKIYR
jgi:hypothetical protein